MLLEYHHVYLLLIIFFLSFIFTLYKRLYNTTSNRLPSPRRLPVIGNLHQLGTLPHRSLRSLSNRYGELMLLHLGSKPALVVSSPRGAEEVMKTYDTVFAYRPNSKLASLVLHDGRDIAFGKYPHWKKAKSICVLHMLSNKKVRSFRQIREEEVQVMLDSVDKLIKQDATVINLSDSFLKLTSDVLFRVAFGRKYAAEGGTDTMKALLNDMMEVLGGFTVGDFIPWLGWIDVVNGVLKKAKRVSRAFDVIIEKSIKEHIDATNHSDDGGDKQQTNHDLVDVLLEIQRVDPSLDMETVKALIFDMLAAGIETTTTLLEWTMSELLLHPQVMKQMQEEVRRYIKEKKVIEEDDLKNMIYLKAVIKEALRLHPSLPLLAFRESSADVKVQGFDVAKGTIVIVNAWAIQRHQSFWEDPEKFKPERFLDSSLDMTGRDFEYIPFGAGRRGCPGMQFALVKAELALANLVANFDWRLVRQVQPESFLAECFGAAVHRRDPLLAIPTPHLSDSDTLLEKQSYFKTQN